jgi:hypothetical protein
MHLKTIVNCVCPYKPCIQHPKFCSKLEPEGPLPKYHGIELTCRQIKARLIIDARGESGDESGDSFRDECEGDAMEEQLSD